MITFADIFDRMGDIWAWLSTGIQALKLALKKLSTNQAAFMASAAVMGKVGYDKIKTYIEAFTAGLGTIQHDALDGSWSALQFIQFANYIFPIEELLGSIVLIFEAYIFVLVFKMNWRFRREIRMGL